MLQYSPVKRTEKVRLYPTLKQSERLHFMLDVTRELYNALLEQRRWLWVTRRFSIPSLEQYKQITALRGADARFAALYRECEDAVLHRLDLAFVAFYRRANTGGAPGFPRFKPATRWRHIEFPHGNRALRLDERQRYVTIPGIGKVRLRRGRRIGETYGRALLIEKNGRWYADFECERASKRKPEIDSVAGVDRGVHALVAFDDGRRLPNPRPGERRLAAIACLQRELEMLTLRDNRGCVLNRGDVKRIAATRRFARAKEREANARHDALHKLSRSIVDSVQVICLERLRLNRMTRSAKGTIERPGRSVRAKSVLNRKVLDSGFGLLRRMIVKKAEEALRTVVEVDARYSSTTCSSCGHVDSKNRRGRLFRCRGCGHLGHADVEAAREIRRRAESQLMRRPHALAETAHDLGRAGLHDEVLIKHDSVA